MRRATSDLNHEIKTATETDLRWVMEWHRLKNAKDFAKLQGGRLNSVCADLEALKLGRKLRCHTS